MINQKFNLHIIHNDNYFEREMNSVKKKKCKKVQIKYSNKVTFFFVAEEF